MSERHTVDRLADREIERDIYREREREIYIYIERDRAREGIGE